MSYSDRVELNADEESDFPMTSKHLGRLVRGQVSFEEIVVFLSLRHEIKQNQKEGVVPKAETELANLILEQRLRQLISKFLATAVVKEGKVDVLRRTLASVRKEQESAAATIREKAKAVARVRELETELRKAVEKVENDLKKETHKVDEAARLAEEHIKQKEAALETTKQALAELQQSVATHQRTLEDQQAALQAIRDEIVLHEENREHQELMGELRAELDADIAEVNGEFERLRAHVEHTTQREIEERIERECGEDLRKAEEEEKTLKEQIVLATVALQEARAKLELLQQQSQNKDHELTQQVHAFDVRVDEEVVPLREEVEQMREEVFGRSVHEDRRTDLERQLARLQRDLAEVQAAIADKEAEAEATKGEFEALVQAAREEKTRKLDAVKANLADFREEAKERQQKVDRGLEHQQAIARHAELKKEQVDNLYARIRQLETGLKLKSADLELIRREITNAKSSARVFAEEEYLAEKLEEAAQKEKAIKEEIKQSLEEKAEILEKLKENVEQAKATVKGHAVGSDANKQALERVREVDDLKLKQLRSEVDVRGKQIDGMKKYIKNMRDEVTALEKVKSSLEREGKASSQLLAHLKTHQEWYEQHAKVVQEAEEVNRDNSLAVRMDFTAKATDQRIKDVKAIAYAVEDRVKATAWRVQIVAARVTMLTQQLELLTNEVALSEQRVQLLEKEIENCAEEARVEEQRKELLRSDIGLLDERAKLLAHAAKNAEGEARLHKLAAAMWQGKIKVVRDESKVREARLAVLEEDIARLRELKAVRLEAMEMLKQLDANYEKAVSINEEEVVVMEKQHSALQEAPSE